MVTNNNFIRPAIILILAIGFILTLSFPASAYRGREFEPLATTEIYERDFIDDFFEALGYRPELATWVQESGTLRVLVDGAVKAENGDIDAAMISFDALPREIARAFPFLTAMREDLLVPDVLDPWYDDVDSREHMFEFYESVWLPHPEYRDDYMSFKEDTAGRMSSRDVTEPAVWIRGHLSYYGFIEDRAIEEDDHYLFLWDLLTRLSIYANRATFYGLDWAHYDEDRYQRAVVGRIGEIIKGAHDEAVRQETARGFWFDVISAHQPMETVSEGTESTSEIYFPASDDTVSRPGVSEPEPLQPIETVEETDYADLFRVEEEPLTDEEQEIIDRAADLEERVEAASARIIDDTPQVEDVPVVDDVTGPEIIQDETTDVPDETIPVPDDTPDESIPGLPDRSPSELAPEDDLPTGISNYGVVRLEEISDDLAIKIAVLANDLGSETVDLVILYNEDEASDELLVNTEDRYVAKREAFLAGLAVWDRFHMEVYSPLTLADFNDLILADLRDPFEEFKLDTQRWGMYWQFEAHFEEALGQIEGGIRNRRDQADVLAAEQAALTRFLPDYNDLIKEIEDILAETESEEPAETELEN